MSSRELIILGSSSQQHTRHRNQGAYLFRWNGEGLLFDPGEGTQRQFILANVAPTTITRIFISHFHGDHCLGLGSILMRLNLDKVSHPIHCYYPASGKKFFDRLRYSTIYHEVINVVEHPIDNNGIVEDFGSFKIEASFLEHGVETLGWRITEPTTIKFCKEKLKKNQIFGIEIKQLLKNNYVIKNNKKIFLQNISYERPGDIISVISDTRFCDAAISLSLNARLLLCESTYLEEHKTLAHDYFHLTAKQAATIAKQARVKQLVLTHFSARYSNLKEFEKEASLIFPNVFIAEDLKIISFKKNESL